MDILLLCILIGSAGTVIGAFLTFVIGRRSDKMICYLLSFAGGIMAAVAVFELIPESAEMSNEWIAVIGIAIGALVVFLLNFVIDHFTKSNKHIHETPEELYHNANLSASDKMSETNKQIGRKRMMRAGAIMLIALALHNLPEGLAIGAAFSYEASLGITIAVLLALHNIPEGMAVAATLKAGGMKKWKIVLWVIIIDIPILIGGLLGFWIGSMSDITQAMALAIAGGAMLYVVFGEIIPQSVSMTKSRMPTIIALLGIIIGLLIVGIEFGW